jgi:hypothetical protein
MIKDGKIFGKINIIDFLIILIVTLAIAGVTLVKSGKFATSSKAITKIAPVNFDVVIRGQKLSKDDKIFINGEKTFITIRNVPYTSLIIKKAERTRWQTVIPDPKNPLKAISVDDPSAPYTYNFFVTLEDTATVTGDGPVIGGNKIKIGLPVTLEGYNYRLTGVVSDVRVLDKK